ncbi:uncharacterized protein F54H12.2-like [Ischnura elegans]|uniref:uncharacterized protein F54H12.2-like n=1 Tax=Ischnura elegans TaxID=197161 RepID=UPI001ED88DDD|nr:uncharacterized protein F54H12.2-like [Ischnura elegans]
MTTVLHSSLDLFSVKLEQHEITGRREIPHKPTTSLDSATTIEFHVRDGGSATYKDLSSARLSLKVKLTKLDGSDYTSSDEDQPGVVNNILHSMFSQCNVEMNGHLVTPFESNYHYRAYLETILNYGLDASNTHLKCAGWVLDGEGEDLENEGYAERKKMFKNSRVVQLEGRIFSDVLNQEKFMLNGVDVKMKFSLAKDAFYIKEKSQQSKLKILDATLYMTHYNVSHTRLLSDEKYLLTNNAVYPYRRTDIKTFTIQRGVRYFNQGGLVQGKLPIRILFAMISHDAYVGSCTKNPFKLQHFNITNYCLYYNGQPIPSQGLEMSFDNLTGFYTHAYLSMINGIGNLHSDRGNTITKEMFAKGYFIIVQDLTPDGSSTEDHTSPAESGDLVVDITFASSLPAPVMLLMYAEYESAIEVDKTRSVYLRF